MFSESQGKKKRNHKKNHTRKSTAFFCWSGKLFKYMIFRKRRVVNCFSVQNWSKGMKFVELYMIKESQFPCDIFVTNKYFFLLC